MVATVSMEKRSLNLANPEDKRSFGCGGGSKSPESGLHSSSLVSHVQ